MANSARPGPHLVQVGALPFGDDDPVPENGDRIAGILAGNEPQLAEAAVNMIQVGGGIAFSGTSDGGAVSVTVFFGRKTRKKYAASPEALSALLEAVSGWTPAQPPDPRPTRPVGGDRRH